MTSQTATISDHKEDLDVIPRKQSFSFTAALGGQNIIFGIQLSFLMYAFTDILGLLPAAVGTLVLVARLWDGFNDPLMGILADRTNTRWGKFRPWLLFVPVPLAIVTTLCFYNPGFSYTGTLIYAYVIYILWGMLYTLTDIPIWALSTVMTRSSSARTKMVSIARSFSTMGILVPTILIPVLAEKFSPEDPSQGYFYSVAIFAVLSVPLITLAFFGVKERLVVKRPKIRLSDTVNVFRSNRPLQLVFLTMLCSSLTAAPVSAVIYFATYNLGDAKQMGIISLISMLGMIIGMAFTPMMIKRIQKKGVIIATSILRVALLSLYFYLGYDDLITVYIMTFVLATLNSPFLVLQPIMVGDSVDYAEWKTGIRSEGVAFSCMTFANKVITALGAFAVGLILSMTHYVAGTSQTQEAMDGIFLAMTVLPAISCVLMLIPIKFYSLTDEKLAEISKELEVRNEK
ncbi:MFS transporter [Vibrio cionasavignyae]|uniref:MFS transporter n=1 Tax=Vibrio cionasavignyae TaxID=2910252 RepID=UPI003D0BF953